jgi:hypothetical protein
MKMKRLLVLGASVAVPAIVILGLLWAALAYLTRRPADMRAENTVWVKAPLTFGSGQGWWLGCWIDSDQQSNRCRLYDRQVNPPIVYEGRYLVCEGQSPVPLNQLKIKPPDDPRDMWLRPDGVAVVLQDGRLLVPTVDREDCAKIRANLEDRHELPTQTSQ